MLVLTRKVNESIVIGNCIVVKVTAIVHGMVKLGIDAPESIPVHRHEVHESILGDNPRPPKPTAPPEDRLPALLSPPKSRSPK